MLSSLLARQRGASLRIITLTQPPDPANIASVLATHRIATGGPTEFLHAGPDRAEEVPVNDGELFVTTSWWSTRCVRPLLHPSQILYLLQEDERMFYPQGDDYLRCAETLSDPDIRFVVNSRLLFRHLTEGPGALASIAARGKLVRAGLPGVREGTPRSRPRAESGSSSSMRGRIIQETSTGAGLRRSQGAIEENLLDPDHWDFHFAGKDLAPATLPRGVRPSITQNLPWPEYVRLIRRMDVGLCLMDTPHPSYPPLDIAASGATAVTNRHGIKQSLAQYSDNIICVDPTVAALQQGIAAAVARSRNVSAADNISRDWQLALAPLMASLCS